MKALTRTTLLAVIMLIQGASTATCAEQVDTFKFVPADAHVAIVIPNLKSASDDLTRMLRRMQREDLLGMVGRPIDLLKSTLGISAGVNDSGAAALIISDITSQQLTPIALVPVNDGDRFIESNFTAASGKKKNVYTTTDGQTVSIKKLDTHIAIATKEEALQSFELEDGSAEMIKQSLGQDGIALINSGDILFYADRAGLQYLVKQSGEEIPVPMAEQWPLSGATDHLLLSIDIDPLCLALRTVNRLNPQSQAAALFVGENSARESFKRLPAEPYYFAAAADFAGLGGIEALQLLSPNIDWPIQAKAMETITGIEFGVYPSRLGVAVGGVLNNAALVLETEAPEQVLEEVRSLVLSTAGEWEGEIYAPQWDKEKKLPTGESADSFTIETSLGEMDEDVNASEVSMRSTIRRIIFGRKGITGLAKATDNAVVLTFSQRPAVLTSALSAVTGGESLATDPVITAMGKWLPENRRMEMYLSVGRLTELLRETATMMPGGGAEMIPKIDPSLEPIGFGLAADSTHVQSSLVIPSGVMKVIFNQFVTEQGKAAR